MIGKRFEIPRMQSDFYKNWYHRILHGILINAVIIVSLILGMIYLIVFIPEQKYYATTTEGQIIQIVPK